MDCPADVFAAIAAPGRRQMLEALSAGEMPVKSIAERFGMSMSAVSQQLSVLRSAGLVSSRKHGKQRLYTLNAEPLESVAEWVGFYEPFWRQRLARLGEFLEENP